MRTRDEVSPAKLRGGFYTPPNLVAHALTRLVQLGGTSIGRLLEPSVGDGAFIGGIAESALRVREVVGVELLPEEASKARIRLDASGIAGTVIAESTLTWATRSPAGTFDAVVGNLPFVRFQFVSTTDRACANDLAAQMGVSLRGVSNLWIPMMLASMRQLRVGGAFVLVLPAESLTGVSAGSAREWLLKHVEDLRCDLYPAGSFPGALQEVVLLSGRISARTCPVGELTMASHGSQHSSRDFTDAAAAITRHTITPGPDSWTRHLLTPAQLDALAEFKALPEVVELGRIARFQVAAVTGANSYFSLSQGEVAANSLQPWARPLLPRIRHASGLRFTIDDYRSMDDMGHASYLFDAAQAPCDRTSHRGLDAYLAYGESLGIHDRYKCRIREPWWSIPSIHRGELLLSKRCHRFPRLVVNETEAVTTDTIYRGQVLNDVPFQPAAIAAGFHNSGTLLTAELEGRTFGGGVLELVPSEVARLAVPLAADMADEVDRLDLVARDSATSRDEDEAREALVRETDLLLGKSDTGPRTELLNTLADARGRLLSRRLARNTAERVIDPND